MSLGDHDRQVRPSGAIERRRLLDELSVMVRSDRHREFAEALGLSRSAIGKLRSATTSRDTNANDLLAAAAPVLEVFTRAVGYSRLAVFGSFARGETRHDSDLDLIVEPPVGASSFELMRVKQTVECLVGREVDLISYGSLRANLDRDIVRDARPLRSVDVSS